MQEFDLEIKDRHGVENVVVDHLFLLSTCFSIPLLDVFIYELIFEIRISSIMWFAHIENYLVMGLHKG